MRIVLSNFISTVRFQGETSVEFYRLPTLKTIVITHFVINTLYY